MRKLRIFCAAVCLFSALCVSGQGTSFNQGFGLTGMGTRVKETFGSLDSTGAAITNVNSLKLLQFGIVYYPRVDLVSWKSGSVSIGSPLMMGISFATSYNSFFHRSSPDSSSSTTGPGPVNFAFSVPVVADLNIGLHSAAEESGAAFGLYVGGGYAYNYTRYRSSIGYRQVGGYESLFRGGIRLGRNWENRFTIGFTLRGAFMDDGHPRTYEFQLVKDL